MSSLLTTLFSYANFNGISICLILGCLVIYIISLHRYYSGTPPGPWGVPLFGYTLFLTKETHKDFKTLGKKYGDIFSIGFGTRHVTVLNNYKDIKDALLKPRGIFHGRELNGVLKEDFGENKMIFITDGELWRLQRNLFMRALKDTALAHSRLETWVQTELKFVVETLLKSRDQLVNLSPVMRSAASNVVSFVMFEKRFSFEEENIVNTLEAIDDLSSTLVVISPLFAIMNHLRWIPGKFRGLHVLQNLKSIIYNFVDKMIEDHEQTYGVNNMRDVLDVYIRESKKSPRKENFSLEDEILTKPYIRANAFLLFSAGTDTTANFLSYVFQILAAHPDIQKELQNEIDDVYGYNGTPKMSDLCRMPYTEAVILEIMRYTSIVPIAFFHRVTDKLFC